ncbi:hypothetical protein QBC36DRAFT_298130 [Triangularia setosa]|uniref:Uncharacterized protein n=1 Tax=Triangularia setosa TaxID=2587417 RepID=A0AAN7ABA5_9PEZI|nr:hypothetical protein QBC36DRAFT_298130 [Podospora setosa]
MADRHHNPLPPSSRLITTTTAHIPSKPSSRLIQQPPGPSTASINPPPPTASSVRRNLFQSQLTRRPPHPSSSTSSETIRLNHHHHHSHSYSPAADDDDPYQDHPLSPPSPPAPSPSADIVPRNSLGEIELLGDPPTPPLYDSDSDNHPPSSPSHSHHHSHNPNDHQKAEQAAVRNRLTEAVRQHQLHQNKLLMSVPGSNNMGGMMGMGMGMHPPLNTQPEGQHRSPLLFSNSSSSFLFSPETASHCSDPFCTGSGPSSSSPKLVYYPSSSSSPKIDNRKGKGKMVDVKFDDVEDHDQENENDGVSFAKTKKFTETELVEEVKTNLRAKVAALTLDNWMFEPEELPRPH